MHYSIATEHAWHTMALHNNITRNASGVLLQDFIDTDPLLAFCALEQANGTPLLRAISQMAMFYARHDDAVIPACLQAGGVGG